jgi:hypothetical protein
MLQRVNEIGMFRAAFPLALIVWGTWTFLRAPSLARRKILRSGALGKMILRISSSQLSEDEQKVIAFDTLSHRILGLVLAGIGVLFLQY